jgi:hypothetical protein
MANLGNALSNQITNRNFLSTGGFKFVLNRVPKVTFFSNEAGIPGLNLGVSNQPSYLKDLDIPGDKIEFDDFRLRFLVDENLENYMQIQKWIRGLGYPESLKEIFDLQNEPPTIDNRNSKMMNIYSDGSLVVLNSNYSPQFKVIFEDMFPYALSSLDFNAQETDTEYFTAEVSFKYTVYYITDMKGNRL